MGLAAEVGEEGAVMMGKVAEGAAIIGVGVDRTDKVAIHSGSIGAGVDGGMEMIMSSCPWIADSRPLWPSG